MHRWVLVVGAMLGCGQLQKPADPSRRLELHVGGSSFESNAGYRFAVIPEPDAQVVRLDVRYPVGSVDDPPGKEGLAHLIEHLLFDVEIDRNGKTSISAELGRLALAWNAETTADYTNYQVVAKPEAVDELLGLETDRLTKGCGGISPAIFTREREVVLNELRERQGAGGADYSRKVHEALYPAGHPYRRVDTVETVAKLDFKDVCDFLNGPYRRGVVTVVASGAITDAAFRKAVEHRYASVSKRHPAARAALPVLEPDPGIVRITADVDEPLVMFTWPLPPVTTREARALELVYNLMAFFLERRATMFRLGYGAEAFSLGGPSAPALALAINVSSPDELGGVKIAADAALTSALRFLGRDKDSTPWRIAWQGQAETYLARWENLGGRNDMAATQLAAGSKDLLIGQIKELSEGDPLAIREIAQKWLAIDRAKLIVVEPSGKASAVAKVARGGDGEAEHLTVVDASLADQPLPPPRMVGLQTIRYTLDNGIQVILWPHGTSSLVHGRLVIDAGRAHDPAGSEGVADLVGGSVYEDQLVFSDREISTRVDDAVESLGAHLRKASTSISDDDKTFLKGQLRRSRGKERRDYEHELVTAVYGAKHPYARPLINEQSVDTLHTDLVTGWIRSHFVGANATVVLTGQFDADVVKKHIAYRMDQVSSGTPTPTLGATIDRPTKTKVFGVTQKAGPSVELDIVFAGGRGIDPEYADRLVLADVIESRLQRMRGEKAITYGMHVEFEPRALGGVWRISGKADASRAAEATKLLLQILGDMRKDPESYRADFVLARQKVLERIVVGANDSGAMADQLVLLARFKLADDYTDQLAATVAKLTLKDLHAFFQRELPADHQVFGAFGDQDAVNAAKAASQ